MDVVTQAFDAAMGRAVDERLAATSAAVQVLAADLAVLKKGSQLLGWSKADFQAKLKEISDGFDARRAEIERKHTEEVAAALSIINLLLNVPVVGPAAVC